MAIAYQGNRITFWIGRCIVFHIFTMAILGEYRSSIHSINIRYITRGKQKNAHFIELPHKY